MTGFKQATNIVETPAKMRRVGRAKSVVDVVRNQTLTREEIGKQCNIPSQRLQRLLAELREYGIVSVVELDKREGVWQYRVKKPANIEQLKNDMMGAKA